MKRKLLYTLLVAIFIFISYTLYLVLNPVSPLETVNFSNKDKIISVTYSRPYKKDRLIFGNQTDGALVPYGIYWRTGANRHTVIETETDPQKLRQELLERNNLDQEKKDMWDD